MSISAMDDGIRRHTLHRTLQANGKLISEQQGDLSYGMYKP